MVSFVIGRPASGKTYNVVRNEILKHEDSVILICLKKEFEYMDILDPSESFVKEEGDYQAVSWLHVNGSMEIRKYNEIFLDFENGESEAKMDEYKENILSMLREHKFSGTPLIVFDEAQFMEEVICEIIRNITLRIKATYLCCFQTSDQAEKAAGITFPYVNPDSLSVITDVRDNGEPHADLSANNVVEIDTDVDKNLRDFSNIDPTDVERAMYRNYGLYKLSENDMSICYAPIHTAHYEKSKNGEFPAQINNVAEKDVEWENQITFCRSSETVMLGDEIKLKCAHHYDYELLSLILKRMDELGFKHC